MAQNKKDMQKSFEFLKESGGTSLSNSNGIRLGNTIYKPSESGRSVVTDKGERYTSHTDLRKSVNGKK